LALTVLALGAWTPERPPKQIRGVVPTHFFIMQNILETDYQNASYNTSSPTWARNITNGHIFLQADPLNNAKFEWTPVLDPTNEYDLNWIGASGVVISPDDSGKDDPFLHPFGFDWEFFLAPDPPYQSLAAPTNDSLYVGAVTRAKQQFGISVPNMLGVEWDGGLVPDIYRALEGDRVCVWGRWIVDTGHDDFHTEIHPPALLVAARATPPGSTEKTQVTLLSRPYLVSQTFSDGHGLEGHLLEEIGKCEALPIPLSTRVEAHPQIMPKPFWGTQTLSFTVRPPTGRRAPTDQLQIAFHFTVRDGEIIQLLNGGNDSVKVLVVMNDSKYKAPPLPKKNSVTITRDDLAKLNGDAGDVYLGAEILSLLNPLGEIFLQRGILTDSYDKPQPVLGTTTITNVNSLPGLTPVTVNNDQPYPLAGSLSLTWIR
jgi:hypothetical protein